MSEYEDAMAELDGLLVNMRYTEWTPSNLDDLRGLAERLRGCDSPLAQADCSELGIGYDSTYEQGAKALFERYGGRSD